MDFIEHTLPKGLVIEVTSEACLISSEQDALDIIANVRYLYDSQIIIFQRKHLSDAFFDLRTGLAGAVMQKLSNYRFRAAIVGDFNSTSKSLAAFISESNRTGQVVFTKTIEEGLQKLGH